MMRRAATFTFGPVGTTLAVLACLLVAFLPGVLGRAEGRFFPVVRDLHLVIAPASPVASEVRGRFNIVRPGCDFHHIEWRLVGQYRTALVGVDFLPGPKVRPGGVNDFGPWLVHMSPAELETASLAAVFHQCPGRPWLTVTHFYP